MRSAESTLCYRSLVIVVVKYPSIHIPRLTSYMLTSQPTIAIPSVYINGSLPVQYLPQVLIWGLLSYEFLYLIEVALHGLYPPLTLFFHRSFGKEHHLRRDSLVVESHQCFDIHDCIVLFCQVVLVDGRGVV